MRYEPPPGLEDAIHVPAFPPDCSPDIWIFYCSPPPDAETVRLLPGGESITFDFTWQFGAAGAGKEFQLTAELVTTPQESDVSNDEDVLKVHVVASGTATPTASRTPTETALPTAGSTSARPTSGTTLTSPPGSELAATGTQSSALVGLAAGLALMTAGLVLLASGHTRGRRV